MSQDPIAVQAAPPGAPPAPWGLLGTIVWGAAGVCAWFVVQFAVIVGFLAWHNRVAPASTDLSKMANDGFLLAFVTIAAAPAWIGVSVFAARLRKWRARDYLALVPPRRAEMVFGIACLAALLIAFDLFTYLIGRDVVPSFMREAYMSARSSGSLVLFFIAVVIVAPISEEIAFRGFLFRGLSASWLGVSGATIATSAAWAAMHVQYCNAYHAVADLPDRAAARLDPLGERLDPAHDRAARAGKSRGLHPGGDQGRSGLS